MKGCDNQRKILLVDDDYANQILINELLEHLDVNIIECNCGKEAMEGFKQYTNDIALVLLDIKLPDCKGWDLCKQLRLVNDRMPIIAMSALQPSELARHYKAAGFTTYISKPFDMVEFVEMVSAYV